MPFGLGPKLECRDCGHKGRPSISDGMGYLSDSNYHVKCPKCGNNMWADDPTGAWKKRAEEERAKRGLEDAAAKAPTPAPEPAPAPAPEPEPEPIRSPTPPHPGVSRGDKQQPPSWENLTPEPEEAEPPCELGMQGPTQEPQ